MGWLFSTFGFCVLSALVPIFNAEVYLTALAATESPPLWPMAAVAAAGQMIGKVVYYFIGKSSLDWRWVKRRTDTPASSRPAWSGGAAVGATARGWRRRSCS